MRTADIVVVGSGSLATKVINAMTQLPHRGLRVAIVGRSESKVTQMALIANARVGALSGTATFVPVGVTQFRALGLQRIFRALKPKVIFHAASIQSPWEASLGENGWTKLVASAGFGITLPLQISLALEVCQGATDSKAAIVNASYPDCVNVLLARLGVRADCGIGNSAIVEAFCRSHEIGRGRDVRVIGHHGHLGGWLRGKRGVSQPRVWIREREKEGQRFRPSIEPIGEELNEVTSTTAVSVIDALLTGETRKVSVPGVGGLPGGYPFILKRRKFTMRLPPKVAVAEAIAHNKTGEQLDGLDLGAGVKFVDEAVEALDAAGFEYAHGFDFAEWKAVHDRMLALRTRLRSET